MAGAPPVRVFRDETRWWRPEVTPRRISNSGARAERRPGRSGTTRTGAWVLSGVCFDESVDQVVDIPGLGEAAVGELVAQFGLCQSFVGLPSLRAVLLDPFTFRLPGLPGVLLLGPRGLFGLFLGDLLGLLGLASGQVGEGVGLVLDDPGLNDSACSRVAPVRVFTNSAHPMARPRFRSTVRWTNWKYCSTDWFRSTDGTTGIMVAWSASFFMPSFQAPAAFSVVSRAWPAAVLIGFFAVMSLLLGPADDGAPRCGRGTDRVSCVLC